MPHARHPHRQRSNADHHLALRQVEHDEPDTTVRPKASRWPVRSTGARPRDDIRERDGAKSRWIGKLGDGSI